MDPMQIELWLPNSPGVAGAEGSLQAQLSAVLESILPRMRDLIPVPEMGMLSSLRCLPTNIMEVEPFRVLKDWHWCSVPKLSLSYGENFTCCAIVFPLCPHSCPQVLLQCS